MKQLFEVSSLLQLVNLHAAIDSGLIEDAEERILLISDNRIINEVGPSFSDSPFAAPLLDVFDRRIDLNEWLHPYHPAQWGPRDSDIPVWTRFFSRAWGVDNADLQLYVESLQAHPALALARVFSRAEVRVHSDGLMSYGPTRNRVESRVRQRLSALYTMDLVPGLTPRLLSEYGVEATVVDRQALRDTLSVVEAQLPAEALAEDREATVIIGQYLSDIGLFSVEEEVEIYSRLLEDAAAHSSVYFKPHPAASASVSSILAHLAADRGIEFHLLPGDVPVEVCIARLRPATVAGCFSTGLATAHSLFGSRVIAAGTEHALENFTPYENSNRIPVTICDHLFSADAQKHHRAYSLQDLVDAVSYCMRADQLPALRETAVRFLDGLPEEDIRRYFKRRRLTKLDLPGRLPPAARLRANPVVLARRAARKGGRTIRELGLPVPRV
ncbi:polysialyltransferase family glycosyltransferase [Brevibacterium sp.]|uniref:polysialyltransferase family glycosyltransferase n=1 Tax=Brevibacterium sp. TaxID=1701 RepID=UPI0028121945|nr:polysialyltransferase family glycosyltransferase [Brevibacterium sp.]